MIVRRISTGAVALIAGYLCVAQVVQPAAAFFVPQGTYLKSCRAIQNDGPYLSAFCARIDGRFRPTRIFVPRCRGTEISNQNGHLSCGE